jgi:hypothetical protein
MIADANVALALAFDPVLARLYAGENAGAVTAYRPDLAGADAAHGIPALSGSHPKGVAVAF